MSPAMFKTASRLAAVLLISLLGACGPNPIAAKLGLGPADKIDTATLDSDIDRDMGGLDTCVVVLDTTSGRRLYQYGVAQACEAQLPPCETFDIANSLIGLDLGVITPGAVVKWDGSPQPVALWRTDADLAKAFHDDIGWWFQHLAAQIGHDRYQRALGELDYGNRDISGPPTQFWMGAQAGGGLTLTEGQQASFIRRFYAGDLKIQPQAIALVQGLTQQETRAGGKAVISGRVASCAATADGSQNVAWWVGRIKTAGHDLSFSASIEGENAPPGLEIQRRLTNIFTDAKLLPPA